MNDLLSWLLHVPFENISIFMYTFFWQVRLWWPLLSSPFCIFERCLDSNLQRYAVASRHATSLAPTSLISRPFPYLAAHLLILYFIHHLIIHQIHSFASSAIPVGVSEYKSWLTHHPQTCMTASPDVFFPSPFFLNRPPKATSWGNAYLFHRKFQRDSPIRSSPVRLSLSPLLFTLPAQDQTHSEQTTSPFFGHFAFGLSPLKPYSSNFSLKASYGLPSLDPQAQA